MCCWRQADSIDIISYKISHISCPDPPGTENWNYLEIVFNSGCTITLCLGYCDTYSVPELIASIYWWSVTVQMARICKQPTVLKQLRLKKNTWKKHYVRIGLFWQFWITIELFSTFIKKDRSTCMCIDFNSQANNFANIRGHKPANITILLVQQSDGQLGMWLAAFYFTKFSLTTL